MGITKTFLFVLLLFLPLYADVAPSTQEREESAVSIEQEEPAFYPKPEGSPPEISGDGYQRNFTRTLGLLVFVIVAVIMVGYLLRSFTNNRPLLNNQRKNIKILERRPLSQSTQLYLVQIGNQHFILAESKLEVRNVATLDNVNLDV